MRKFVTIFQWIFVALLIFTLLLSLLAQGSSHKIPPKTYIEIGTISLVLVALLVLSVFIKKKIN